MNSLFRLFVSCRVLRRVHKSVLSIPAVLQPVAPLLTNINYKTMAQRTITSFFNVTPSKHVDDVKNKLKLNGDDTNKANGMHSVIAHSPAKREASSKRARLESSGSDSSPVKKDSSPLRGGSDKKKKTKRQRIESSESESEESPQNKTTSPSPKCSPVKVNAIKLEKTSPKTYTSPKSKRKKLVEVTNVSKSPSPKKVKQEDKDSKKSSPNVTKVDKKVKSAQQEEEIKSEKDNEIKSETKDIVPEVEYNPAKANYHPVEDACWAAGAPVPYLALCRTLELIEATSARLKIIDILSNYLRSVIALTPEDLLPSVYLCLNQLGPAYEGLELGIAETYLMKAVGQCTGRSLAQLRAAAARAGDLGRVAQGARAAQRVLCAPPALAARRVLAALADVARTAGPAAVQHKINKIRALYVACRHSESRYLIRSLEGKLRIGLAEQSVLQALAVATATTPPGTGVLNAAQGMAPEKFKAIVDEHALIIKTTYCECPNYSRIIPVLLEHGVSSLPQHCRLTPGVPLKPMLAHPTKHVTHVFDRFEKEQFTCEWKYDGERAQIHVPGRDAPELARAAVFSRNQENNTSKYPDVLRRLPLLLKGSVTSCVLDCEAVAYDTATKQILPFQILSTRKRKDASEADIKVQVCVFVFDLLFLNGQALVREPLLRRRSLLRDHFNEHEGLWQFATHRDCGSVEEVEEFMEEAVRGSCEGLMVKALSGQHARYDIARRSHNWLKLKKDYLEGVGDTIDVVVIGAYRGRGKRAGTYGGFLLACYEPDSDEYQSLCKIGTGFSDADLLALSSELEQHVIPEPKSYYRYSESHAPDAWLAARCVWEVRGADLSLSPAHRAAIGLVHPDKGISLRFPRFVRVRDDKRPEQATAAQQVASMYLAQDQIKNTARANTNLDDFY